MGERRSRYSLGLALLAAAVLGSCGGRASDEDATQPADATAEAVITADDCIQEWNLNPPAVRDLTAAVAIVFAVYSPTEARDPGTADYIEEGACMASVVLPGDTELDFVQSDGLKASAGTAAPNASQFVVAPFAEFRSAIGPGSEVAWGALDTDLTVEPTSGPPGGPSPTGEDSTTGESIPSDEDVSPDAEPCPAGQVRLGLDGPCVDDPSP